MATEVGTAYVTLIPSARGFATRMQSELAPEVSRAGTASGTTFGNSMATSSSSVLKTKSKAMFSALKVAGVAAAAGAGIAIAHTLVDSVNAASDLNETLSKSEQIFGKGAMPALEKYADAAATTLGQSKQQALDAAATFGVFGKSAGLTGGKLADFSTDFTTLASDMASFNNTSPQEAIDAIGAALRGESEPIRRYGVLLDDASMRQEALRQGLIKNVKTALTPAQKVLAAQGLIYQKTKDQQGDFARTSGGLANQQRILSAQWDDMKTRIGQGLLPVVLRLVSGMNSLMEPLGNFFGQLSSGKGDIGKTGEAIQDTFGGIADTFTSTSESLGTAVEQMKGWLEDLQATFSDVVEIVTILWDTFGDDLIRYTARIFDALMLVIGGALRVIKGVVHLVLSLIKGDWSGAWDAIKDILGGVWDIIKGLVKVAMASIKLALSVGLKLIKGIWSRAWDGIKTAFTNIWGGIKSAVSSAATWLVNQVRAIPGKLAGLAHLFLTAGGDLIRAFIDGIKGAGSFIGDIAGSIWDAVRSLINAAIDQLNQAFEFTIPIPAAPDVTVNPPNIPHLAHGGRVYQGMLAVIGEGREPETVLPDSMLRGLLERTQQQALGGAGAVGELKITNWADGTGFFRIVAGGVLSDETRFRRDLGTMHA